MHWILLISALKILLSLMDLKVHQIPKNIHRAPFPCETFDSLKRKSSLKEVLCEEEDF